MDFAAKAGVPRGSGYELESNPQTSVSEHIQLRERER